jgi:hypothetical protein
MPSVEIMPPRMLELLADREYSGVWTVFWEYPSHEREDPMNQEQQDRAHRNASR